jgi:hypothetical protein
MHPVAFSSKNKSIIKLNPSKPKAFYPFPMVMHKERFTHTSRLSLIPNDEYFAGLFTHHGRVII